MHPQPVLRRPFATRSDLPCPRRHRAVARLLVLLALLLVTPLAAEEFVFVPGDVASLQTAIDIVPDGGTIEIAGGTYSAPAGGFQILSEGRGFTIRAAEGATVILDGGGSNEVMFFSNTSVAAGEPVVFEDITFRNGFTTTNSTGGAVTLIRAKATFVDCRFENSRAEPTLTGGGGVGVFTESVATFLRATFDGNSAQNEAGALKVGGASIVYVHDSVFTNNNCNEPGHRVTSAGGAIHVGNASLRITNSRFENNEAGAVGGAVYATAIWDDPNGSDVVISNSYFEGNRAINDPGITPNFPPEGGAIGSENLSKFRIYNSRFIENDARHGGAIGIYRGDVEVYDSVFRGNRSTLTGFGSRFGGTFKASSNDTTSDTEDRRTARLVIWDSFVQGSFGATTDGSELGGCLFVQGDVNRAFGQSGVAQSGTFADHRATLEILRSAFVECEAVEESGGARGNGGALNVVLADFLMQDSILIDNNAEDQGGAIRLVTASEALFDGVTLGGNTATVRGAGIYGQGADLTMVDSQFLGNEISPGVAEAANQSFGAGMFTSHLTTFGEDLDMTDSVSTTLFSDNIGLPIYDGDQVTRPFNDMRYNDNVLASPHFGTLIYRDPVDGGAIDTPSLNSLVITRNAGVPSTTKSTIDNTYQGSAAVAGAILAVPSKILDTVAAGEPGSSTESFLVYAWTGGSATVDGGSVTGGTGFQTAGIGIHTLDVAGTDFTDETLQGALPDGVVSTFPSAISGGENTTVSWSTPGGTFVDAGLDQGLGTEVAATGSVLITPVATTTYRFFAVTQEGGDVAETTVFVDEGFVFIDGFESGDTTAWSSTNP